VGARLRATGLLGGLGLLTRCRVRAGASFFCHRFTHVFSLRGDYRGDDIHHSVREELQENSAGALDRDGLERACKISDVSVD